MKRLRVYVDTSVIGGCLDAEFSEISNRLFGEFRARRMVAVISTATLRELADAPEAVAKILEDVDEESIERVQETDEVVALAQEYLRAGVVPERCEGDALHIACATVHGVDLLVSWNFKHIVNVTRIRGYNAVNLRQGYGTVEIRSPREVVDAE